MRKVLATVAALVAVSVGFAIVEAELWASTTRTFFWLGNISAPYLLLAFTAGRTWMRLDRRLAVAAVVGLVATLVALAAFYGWVTWRGEIAPGSVLHAARRYVVGGLVTGPLFGLLGGLSRQHRSWLPTSLLAATFALEPLAWFVRAGYVTLPHAVIALEIAAAAAVLVAFRPGRRPAVARSQY